MMNPEQTGLKLKQWTTQDKILKSLFFQKKARLITICSNSRGKKEADVFFATGLMTIEIELTQIVSKHDNIF